MIGDVGTKSDCTVMVYVKPWNQRFHQYFSSRCGMSPFNFTRSKSHVIVMLKIRPHY